MSEFREDPITGRRVILVPGRAARPNEHAVAPPTATTVGDCPFCEGNESRTPAELAAVGAPGRRPNGPGWQVRVIPNRFPTVEGGPSPPGAKEEAGRLDGRPASGYHEVVIESPTHSPGLPFLPEDQVLRVLRMCRDRVRYLSERSAGGSVTLFENVGPESGGSLWHPHSQLVAAPVVSPSLLEETEGAERFRGRTGAGCAFEEVAKWETRDGTRRIFDSGGFVAYAPFASAYPFEVRLLPSRHAPSFGEATDEEVEALARRLPPLLQALLSVVPGASYNLVVRAPATAYDRYHWHLDLYPRLVRPDGFDLGSGFHVNTVSPEDAAEALRAALGAKR